MTDYSAEVVSDAEEFFTEYHDEICESITDNFGNVSTDLYNDYDNGDAFIHENYTDRFYSLTEAAEILSQLSEYVESDSGLWEAQEPKDAICTQAAFTYSSAVVDRIINILCDINFNVERLDSYPEPSKEEAEAAIKEALE